MHAKFLICSFSVLTLFFANGIQAMAQSPQTEKGTRIQVNVYEIVSSPIWHSGIVIDGVEYYFSDKNAVKTTSPKGMELRHHRTIEYTSPMSLKEVSATLAKINKDWNGKRYDLFSNNCNYYVNDALKRLGCGSIDREYRDASGLAKGLRHVPGTSTVQELLVKWPLRTKEIPEALESDVKKLAHMPRDVGREVRRGAKKAEKGVRRLGKHIANVMGW